MGHWILLNLPNPSNRSMALWLTQSLTKMSTRNLPRRGEGAAQPTCKADNLLAFYLSVDCLDNVGVSISHNPMGLQGLLQAQLYFLCKEN
jgi:hypothetical protein